MITYKQGNLFDSDADCIFNTVNCEGYMGKGIAYQFKQRFPENNVRYEKMCREGKLRPGTLLTFTENGKTIINFPTKDKWRNPSLMQYIIDGLDEFVRILPGLGIKKAAMKRLPKQKRLQRHLRSGLKIRLQGLTRKQFSTA